MIEIPETKRAAKKEEHAKKFPYAIATGAFLILLPLCFYVLLLREPSQTMRDISPSVIEGYEQAIQGLVAQLSGLQRLQSDFRALDQNILAKVTLAVPESKELPELIVNIHSLVKGVGAYVDSLQISEAKIPSKDEALQRTKTVSIQLSVGTVSYESMKSLVAKMMQNGRFLSIESIQYNPHESKASIVATAHYLSQPR